MLFFKKKNQAAPPETTEQGSVSLAVPPSVPLPAIDFGLSRPLPPPSAAFASETASQEERHAAGHTIEAVVPTSARAMPTPAASTVVTTSSTPDTAPAAQPDPQPSDDVWFDAAAPSNSYAAVAALDLPQDDFWQHQAPGFDTDFVELPPTVVSKETVTPIPAPAVKTLETAQPVPMLSEGIQAYQQFYPFSQDDDDVQELTSLLEVVPEASSVPQVLPPDAPQWPPTSPTWQDSIDGSAFEAVLTQRPASAQPPEAPPLGLDDALGSQVPETIDDPFSFTNESFAGESADPFRWLNDPAEPDAQPQSVLDDTMQDDWMTMPPEVVVSADVSHFSDTVPTGNPFADPFSPAPTHTEEETQTMPTNLMPYDTDAFNLNGTYSPVSQPASAAAQGFAAVPFSEDTPAETYPRPALPQVEAAQGFAAVPFAEPPVKVTGLGDTPGGGTSGFSVLPFSDVPATASASSDTMGASSGFPVVPFQQTSPPSGKNGITASHAHGFIAQPFGVDEKMSTASQSTAVSGAALSLPALNAMQVHSVTTLGMEKALFVASCYGETFLLGLAGNSIRPLRQFASNPFAKTPGVVTFKSSLEGVANGKEMYLVQVGTWKAILGADETGFTLQTELAC